VFTDAGVFPPEFHPHVTGPAFCDEGNLNATAVLWPDINLTEVHDGVTGIGYPITRDS
jgi:hypothetical protein